MLFIWSARHTLQAAPVLDYLMAVRNRMARPPSNNLLLSLLHRLDDSINELSPQQLVTLTCHHVQLGDR